MAYPNISIGKVDVDSAEENQLFLDLRSRDEALNEHPFSCDWEEISTQSTSFVVMAKFIIWVPSFAQNIIFPVESKIDVAGGESFEWRIKIRDGALVSGTQTITSTTYVWASGIILVSLGSVAGDEMEEFQIEGKVSNAARTGYIRISRFDYSRYFLSTR